MVTKAMTEVRAPREMSYLRLVAQGLVEATTAPAPTEAVRRQLAIQGQQVASVPHAIVSRTAGAVRADVEAAFEAGRLVRSWPMRGTVHVTAADDHHWLRVALMHRVDAWARRAEKQLGIDDALLERAGELALAAIADEGPLRRARLLRVWQEGGLMGAGTGAGAGDGTGAAAQRRRHILVRLQREGVLVQGPRRGHEHLVVSAGTLPPAEAGPGGAGGGARGTDGHRAALAEIARRYAASHGPVRAVDLARWTTLPVKEAARALEDAVERTNAADYNVRAERGEVPLTRAEAVGGLRRRYEADPGFYGPRIQRLGRLTHRSIEALAHGEALVLGETMNAAHELLSEIGVSLDLLDDLTQAARQAGALGAKMTGGGLGGCLISLTDSPQAAEAVSRALTQAGAARTWTYRLRTSEAPL